MSAAVQTLATEAPTRTHGRLYWALADTLVIARRHVLHIPQVPEQFLSATVQPMMFILLFRYVFGGAIQTPGTSYVNYLMAGIFVQSIVMEGVTGGISLALDLKQGIIDRFRTLPMAPSAVLSGPIVADVVRNLFVAFVMFAVGLLVGFRPEADPLRIAAAIGLLLGGGFAVSWIGTVVALIMRDPEAVQMSAFIVLLPLSFASSAFVPVESMPGWLQPIVMHQPVTTIVDAVRGLLLGQPVGNSVWLALAWYATIFAVCLPLSVALYRRIGND